MMFTCITYKGDGEGHNGVHKDSKLQLRKNLLKTKHLDFCFLIKTCLYLLVVSHSRILSSSKRDSE